MFNFLATTGDLEHDIARLSMRIITIAAILLVVLVLLTIFLRNRVPKLKPWLFGALSGTLLLPTIFLAASTIYLNLRSESGGPIHWHAEIEFWACGAELELRDPTGFLSNKIGTSTYHEHNDKHIHLEGVVVRKDVDASLGKFMRVTGGYLNDTGLGIPLNEDESTWFATGDKLDGDAQHSENFSLATNANERISHSEKGPVINLKNGGNCTGGSEAPAELQTFVYTYDKANDTYAQRKIDDPENYVIRDESSLGPPADCIIFEFDTPKDKTDKLCEQYGIRDQLRCQQFGVKEYSADLCKAKEVSSGGNE